MANTIQFVSKGQRSGLYLTDYKDIIAELNRVQPTMINQMKKDYRRIAKSAQRDVKNAIPSEPPTSGRHRLKPANAPRSGFIPRVVPGRLTWGANGENGNKQVDAVAIQTPSEKKASRVYRKNRTDAASIARLKVENAGTVLADMAGRSGKYINKRPKTRVYKYSRSASGERDHRVNNQGRGMIKALDKKGKPSRFVWKAAERALPKIERDAKQVINNAIRVINKRMVV